MAGGQRLIAQIGSSPGRDEKVVLPGLGLTRGIPPKKTARANHIGDFDPRNVRRAVANEAGSFATQPLVLTERWSYSTELFKLLALARVSKAREVALRVRLLRRRMGWVCRCISAQQFGDTSLLDRSCVEL